MACIRVKIVHLSTYANGGAFIAAQRLHQGLVALEVDSHMLALHPAPANAPITGLQIYEHRATAADKLQYLLHGRSVRRQELIKDQMLPQYDWFSAPETMLRPEHMALLQEADVIHLHWVAGFLHWPTFFKRLRHKPIVWTMHDENPFTGGCHYAGTCQQFAAGCQVCPQLKPSSAEIIKSFFKTKQKALNQAGKLVVVTPSQWLQTQVGQGALFTGKARMVIPNGLPTAIFTPAGPDIKAKFFLRQGVPVILFVADSVANTRKGFSRLLAALHLLEIQGLELECLVMGNAGADLPAQGAVRYHAVGKVTDPAAVAAVYRSADVFVIASVEDNYPNTVLESLCCGTPVAGYNRTGIAEIIEDGFGHKADEETPNSLAGAITNTLALGAKTPGLRLRIAALAHAKWNLDRQASAYQALYKTLL